MGGEAVPIDAVPRSPLALSGSLPVCPRDLGRWWEDGKVKLGYRPVHLNTLDDEVETFPPKARVY